MGKFSTGLIAGAMLGVGVVMLDKKTIKKAKRMIRQMSHSHAMNWL